MRLRRLAIDRLPGINSPFAIAPGSDDVHVVFGPNAIGKSSICRAVEALYWSDRGPRTRTLVAGEFDIEGAAWRAERDGPHVRWMSADEQGPPSALPAPHTHHCFFLRLRDLIDPARDGTRDIASEIRRQMSGGVDIDAIQKRHFADPGRHPGRRARNAFNEAARKVETAEGAQLTLQRRMDRLEALEAERHAAVEGERRLPSVREALRLADLEQAHAEVREEIGRRPESLGGLTGDEASTVKELQARMDALRERIRDLEAERQAALEAKEGSRLEEVVAPADLSTWRQWADELGRTELELKDARRSLAALARKADRSLQAVGSEAEADGNLDLGNHEDIFRFLRDAERHRLRRDALEARIRLLDNVQPESAPPGETEVLKAEIELLRRWLRSAGTESTGYRWLAVTAGVIAVAGGAALAAGLPEGGYAAAAGLGMLVPAAVLLVGPAAGRRRSIEREFRNRRFDRPDAGDIGEAEARLGRLEGAVAAIESRKLRIRDRDVDRQHLRSDLERLAAAEPPIEERRAALLQALDLDGLRSDIEMVDMAMALIQLREARVEQHGAEGAVRHLEKRQADLLAGLGVAFRNLAERAPEDAAGATALLGDLSDRSAQLTKALEDETRTASELERDTADRAAVARDMAKIYERAGLKEGDLSGLAALLEQLPAHREALSRADDLQHRIGLVRDGLTTAGEEDLAGGNPFELRQLEARLAPMALRAEELRDAIADIRHRIDDARRAGALQNLIADREDSRTALEEERSRSLRALAGRFLLDQVEQEFERNRRPRVLERARLHFLDFTHHGYELVLSRDRDQPRLVAIDLALGRQRELEELSDGTRAQLLLAARLAFAEDVERGTAMPLFLDEALDQSDPARFDAIARSLGRIAGREKRQIFYLTSDPADAERFHRAVEPGTCGVGEIDLGHVRGRTTEPPAAPPPLPTVPDPDGLTAEDYAALLGVPPFSPADGWRTQHLYYVLPDDLPLLHSLLTQGIRQAGQWRGVSDSPLGAGLGSAATAKAWVDARVDLLEVFCEAWNIGRDRPVGRDAVTESGAVSGRYLEPVIAMAVELGGSPLHLLDALRSRNSPELANFRKKSADSLEAWLRDNGYLDDRPLLDEESLRLHALASPPAGRLPEGSAHACLHRWWNWALAPPPSGTPMI